MEASDVCDPFDVGFDGALGELAQGEVIDEFLP